MQIMTTKIQDLETEINNLNKVNMNLNMVLGVKNLEYSEMNKTIELNSFSPLFFCSNKKREEFWKQMQDFTAY